MAFSVYIVRLFPIPFGIHTIILIFLLLIALNTSGDGDLSLSFIASLLSCLALIIFETSILTFIIVILRITPKALFNSNTIMIILGNIHVLLLFIVAFLVNKLYL